ncbi:MAG: class I tRNA ligase family protein [Chloroflexota bacterium]
MTIRVTDTLTGELRPLEPIEPGHVRVYSCGPTVYGPAHVGNFRAFTFDDLLVRYLRFRGLRVTWVMNLTDVDDKIIKAAAAEGVGIGEISTRYTKVFLEDLATLGIRLPDVMPKATDNIEQMVALIQSLVDRGHAYRTDDGSYFFRIASWPEYGRLARLERVEAADMRVGERVESDEYGKDDVRDFAVWKGAKPGEPSWDTAIGPGRPGWHIECSAMSMRYLGESFDIHTGGIDLVFPHHTDEIAQARRPPASRSCATGSTTRSCSSAARRWPSPRATSSACRRSWRAGSRPGRCASRDLGPLPDDSSRSARTRCRRPRRPSSASTPSWRR